MPVLGHFDHYETKICMKLKNIFFMMASPCYSPASNVPINSPLQKEDFIVPREATS
jgi:hypothetical protein